MPKYVTTISGVKIYDDWRDNIVIDSDAIHIGKSRLASENSEDALTWNVFRTLSYTKPNSLWLNQIFNPINISLSINGNSSRFPLSFFLQIFQ